jgi:histidine triad (HIT) family protein
MESIFSRIASGEIPSYKIAEDGHFFAFLDINPVAKGHTLVIPKKEIDNVFELENELFSAYLLFSKRIAIAIQQAIPCVKVGMAVIGLEVAHAHIHLVPLNSMEDINFSKPKLKLEVAEFIEISQQIRNQLQL